MKRYQLIAVCLAMLAGGAATGCFAQSSTSGQEPAADGSAPKDPAVAVLTAAPAPAVSTGTSREQVAHEQEDFTKGAQLARMRKLYNAH
jgi:hypothetical protein